MTGKRQTDPLPFPRVQCRVWWKTGSGVHEAFDERDCLGGRKDGGIDDDMRLRPGRVIALQDIPPSWKNEALDLRNAPLYPAAMLDGIGAYDLNLDQWFPRPGCRGPPSLAAFTHGINAIRDDGMVVRQVGCRQGIGDNITRRTDLSRNSRRCWSSNSAMTFFA